MISSDVGYFLLLLLICFYCLFLPRWIIIHQRPNKAPAELRRRLVMLSALISGFPLISIIFWDCLGIPPTHAALPVFVLFALSNLTPVLGIAVVSYVLRGEVKAVVLTFLGFCFLIGAQILAPPTITLLNIYLQGTSSLVALPVESDHCDDPSIQPVFAHISDLHITERQRTRDGKEPGNGKLAGILQRVNLSKPQFLIISGDVTDEGTAAQWAKVEELLKPLNHNIRIIISPGNHDLNYFFGSDPQEHPWTWFGLKPLVGLDAEPRIFRAAEFQVRHLPEMLMSSGTYLRDETLHVPTHFNLDRFKRQIDECVMTCISQGDDPSTTKMLIASCRSNCANDLESIKYHYYHDLSSSFPFYYIDETSHTVFISMTTSMAESTAVGRNAIGLSGQDQIRNMQAVLTKLPISVKYIVLIQHHPLLWSRVPPFPHFQLLDLVHLKRTWDAFYTSPWFLAAFLHNDIKEGEKIYGILNTELAKRPGTSALIAFGHRHEKSLNRIGSIVFEEAPNLATVKADSYGFYLVGIKANSLRVSWCEVAGK